MNISRRLFIVRSAALASTLYAAPSFKKYPFSLGVMSGDPPRTASSCGHASRPIR